jgi:hypothetical protein
MRRLKDEKDKDTKEESKQHVAVVATVLHHHIEPTFC